MALFFLMGWVYAIYLLYLFILFGLSMVKNFREGSFSSIVLVLSEILFTIIGPIIGFWRFDQFLPEIPFAKQHVLTIILLVCTSSASFWLARLTQRTLIPLVRIILSVGMLQGILLCFITTIHFIAFLPKGIMFPIIGFELMSPLVALIILAREFYTYNKIEFNLSELLPYRAELGFIPLQYKIFQLPFFNRLFTYAVMLIPFLSAQLLLAYACGQDIDALVKAFTHSYGFIFSMEG